MLSAIRTSHAAKINPGGDVKAFQIPEEVTVPDHWTNRLLSVAEMEKLGMEPIRVSEAVDKGLISE